LAELQSERETAERRWKMQAEEEAEKIHAKYVLCTYFYVYYAYVYYFVYIVLIIYYYMYIIINIMYIDI
jgi:hypothetical protein